MGSAFDALLNVSEEPAAVNSPLPFNLSQDELKKINGADEVDPALNLVKGRRGSLLREKMVKGASKKFMVIVDESKLVKHIGASQLAIPVEVVPFCCNFTRRKLEDLFREAGCMAKLRQNIGSSGSGDAAPAVTDNGKYVVDLYLEKDIGDLEAGSEAILRLPGVVEHKMFLGMATNLDRRRQIRCNRQ